jgi:hypothetical protein
MSGLESMMSGLEMSFVERVFILIGDVERNPAEAS